MGTSHLELRDLLLLLAQSVDAETHHVAGFQKFRLRLKARANAGRRAGDDDVARLQHENCEQYQTRCATPNTMVRVEPFCRLSPLTVSHMLSRCGSLISSLVTSQGPSGPNVSQPFPLAHWPPERSIWKARSDTSLARQ